MSKIEKIFIPCCEKDIWFTKICVASIRYWYPNIPIYLIKDYKLGNFSTLEIERYWDVVILNTEIKKFGWGFAKLELLFRENNERVLIVDSDTVFLGRVIEVLDVFDEDFIVSGYRIDPKSNVCKKTYFDIDKLLEFDPIYVFPGVAFNTGQIVATCGKINKNDFLNLIDWGEPPALRFKNIFSCADQGILNYILMKKHQLGQISVKSFDFYKWSFYKFSKQELSDMLKLSQIEKRQGYPYIVHWAGYVNRLGTKSPPFSKMPLANILKFYNSFYYSKVRFGTFLKYFRSILTYLKYKKVI